MTIREGDEVHYDGEAYTVVKIYSTLDLVQSSALLKSTDGAKLVITGVSSLGKNSAGKGGVD